MKPKNPKEVHRKTQLSNAAFELELELWHFKLNVDNKPATWFPLVGPVQPVAKYFRHFIIAAQNCNLPEAPSSPIFCHAWFSGNILSQKLTSIFIHIIVYTQFESTNRKQFKITVYRCIFLSSRTLTRFTSEPISCTNIYFRVKLFEKIGITTHAPEIALKK